MIRVPLSDILRIANPVEDPPWPHLLWDITPERVWAAYSALDFHERHSLPLQGEDCLDGREHARRIAWMMHHFPADPIHIDTGFYASGHWPVEDGNHRLYAATLLGFPEIDAEISGWEFTVAEVFGPDIADRLFRGPAPAGSGLAGS